MNHNIIVISGPSGSGKSTLISQLMDRHPEIIFSTSHTTRPIRGKEVNGRDYHFISREKFLKMVEKDEFVEWAEVYGNYYGTSFREIETKSKIGGDTILALDIDIQGARKIKEKYAEALFIFVVPPSLEILRQRLEAREKKYDRHIRKRLEIAKEELKQYNIYDYIVVNDNLEEAFKVLDAIYTAYQHTRWRQEAFMEKYLITNTG
ncbi:MAG: guanylate kinase [Candidatus Aminicenantes bacterium]|nr:MAG: guanylate kinase [Candidatus Aminicenantes bacterium]